MTKKLISIILLVGIALAVAMPVSAATNIPLKVLVNGRMLKFGDKEDKRASGHIGQAVQGQEGRHRDVRRDNTDERPEAVHR